MKPLPLFLLGLALVSVPLAYGEDPQGSPVPRHSRPAATNSEAARPVVAAPRSFAPVERSRPARDVSRFVRPQAGTEGGPPRELVPRLGNYRHPTTLTDSEPRLSPTLNPRRNLPRVGLAPVPDATRTAGLRPTPEGTAPPPRYGHRHQPRNPGIADANGAVAEGPYPNAAAPTAIGGHRPGRADDRAHNPGAPSYAETLRHYHHDHHDREWWHNHCDRIILISGGYYYLNAGYWYPAWGYDTNYSNYAYDGPIYAPQGLPPDEVVAQVQDVLQQEGYYFGDVDGELGPLTRQAIAAWQRDHGLAITTVVDEPTLQSLGLY